VTVRKLSLPDEGVPPREFYMDGVYRVYGVLAQRNDPLTGVLGISGEQSPGISRRWIGLRFVRSRQEKRGRTLFRSFPVLTTARVGEMKWRNPRFQGESIEIAKTRKTSHEANR
jgi:hypothetical protein